MSPLLTRLALVAAALAVGALAGAFVLATRGGADVGTRVPRSGIVVRPSIEPRVAAFADRVVAELVVLVDPVQIVVDSVRIEADLRPYELTGPAASERTDSPAVSRLRFRYPLNCVTEACTPSDETPVVDLEPGRVVFRVRGRAIPTIRQFDWPPIQVVQRVGEAALDGRRWRADAATLPEADYRVAPRVLAAGLLGSALALVLLAAALALRLVARRAPAPPEAVVDARPPLERALELAVLASRNGDLAERRTTLERVARELGRVGRPELAERARTLAWSPEPPRPEAVEELVAAAAGEAGALS